MFNITFIIRAETYYDTLAARAALGDFSVKYVAGYSKKQEETLVVFTTNLFNRRRIMKRLEGEIDRGAKFEIIETA